MILGICNNASILEVLKLVKLFILIIKIAVPIILVVVVMIDFLTAIKVGNEDLLKKAEQKVVKRAIAAVLIFLVPTLVNVVIKIAMPNTQVGQCLNNANDNTIQELRTVYIEKLIQRAESTKSYVDYSNAFIEVRELKDSELKNGYYTKLESVRAFIDDKIAEEEEKNKRKEGSYSGGNGRTTGDFLTWKQYGEPWSDIRMGQSSTIASIGCLVTSIAINIAKSGVSTPIPNFDPGTFVEALKAHGGLTDGGSLLWYQVAAAVPNFQFKGFVMLEGKSKAEKASLIAEYLNKGYYLTVEVKGNTGQHWVAPISVSGGEVTMADPASTSTNMWSKYDWNNTSEFAYFTAG